MPPNRKTDLSSQDFASLDVALFQTIKAVAVPEQPQTVQQPPNISYWDWPADDDDQLQCLNTHHIESNLLKEAQRLQAKQQHETVVRSQSQLLDEDSESYWDMPTTTVDAVATLLLDAKPLRTTTAATATRPRHHPAPTGADYMTNYWDDVSSDDYWNDPSHTHYKSSKEVTRPAVPTHHAAPADLDRDSYWNESPTSTTKESFSDAYWTDPAESHNKLEYWDWPSFQSKREEKKYVLQQEALEVERAHRLANTAFVEKQLLAHAKSCLQQQQPVATAATLVAAHDDYWVC